MKNFLILVGVSLISFSAQAIIRNAGERRERTVSTSPTIAGVTRAVSRPTISARTVCEDRNNMPLHLVNMMSDDVPSVRFTSNIQGGDQDKVVSLQVGNFIKACADIQAEVTQPEGNVVAVSFRNDFDFAAKLLGTTIQTAQDTNVVVTAEILNGMTMNEKYEACLRFEGILVGFGNDTELRRPQIDSAYTTINFNNTSITFNPNEPMKIIYASPLNLGRAYGAAYDSAGVNIGGLTCNLFEELGSVPVYLHSAEDVRRHRLLNICQHGTPQELRAAMESLGNATELRAILENAYSRQIVRYSDTKSDELESLAREIIDSSDEDTIRQAARRYADILVDLKLNVQKPAIDQLKLLTEERREATEARRTEIDSRILQLNELIGSFDKNSRQFRANDVLDKLLRFGFKNEAETIAEYRLNSHFFGRVYVETGRSTAHGRGAKLSLSGAQRQVEQELNSFRTRADEAERIYYARSGEREYTPEIQGRIDSVSRNRDRQWQRDMERIQRYQGYCQRTMFGFVQNPAKCQEGVRNQNLWQRQALSRRASYNKSIGKHSARLERYTEYEAVGARNRAATDGSEYGDNNSGSSSLLGSYALFDDSTGGAYGGGGMNPSMYPMNGNGMNPMMMGGGMAPYGGQPSGGGMPYGMGMGGMGMGPMM